MEHKEEFNNPIKSKIIGLSSEEAVRGHKNSLAGID